MEFYNETDLIKSELEKTNKRLEEARHNFNFAEAKEMIDYYTYLIMANETLYNYLNKKYKEMCDLERVVLDGVS